MFGLKIPVLSPQANRLLKISGCVTLTNVGHLLDVLLACNSTTIPSSCRNESHERSWTCECGMTRLLPTFYTGDWADPSPVFDSTWRQRNTMCWLVLEKSTGAPEQQNMIDSHNRWTYHILRPSYRSRCVHCLYLFLSFLAVGSSKAQQCLKEGEIKKIRSNELRGRSQQNRIKWRKVKM